MYYVLFLFVFIGLCSCFYLLFVALSQRLDVCCKGRGGHVGVMSWSLDLECHLLSTEKRDVDGGEGGENVKSFGYT